VDTTWTIVFVLGLTALTILLTGPGLWSEKWGWFWMRNRDRSQRPAGKDR
jgi:hypothetical protein